MEMHHPIAAFSGLYEDFCLINEHCSIVTKKPGFPKAPEKGRETRLQIYWRFLPASPEFDQHRPEEHTVLVGNAGRLFTSGQLIISQG
jgi:hypothetical protein